MTPARENLTPGASYMLVTGDFVKTGGMDRANFAVADYAARQGWSVHLVAHRVDRTLASARNVVIHRALKPLNSYSAAAPFLHLAGRSCASELNGRGVRVLVNGGSCVINAANWVHYVHAAYQPEARRAGLTAWRRLAVHRMFLAFERAALSRASLVIANSDRTARDVETFCGVDPRNIRTVYYGTDASLFRPRTDDERRMMRQALAWPIDVPVVAFVGALNDQRKGFDTVFDAWSRLAADPGWPCNLAVIGSGRDAPFWKRRLAEVSWSARVRFLGFSDDVAGVLGACDALISPTRYEAYGLAAHEALCCGLATFVTASAGIAERFPPQLKDFLLPDARDVGDIVHRLREWWRRRHEYVDAQVRFANELRRRSWDDMSAEIVDLMNAART